MKLANSPIVWSEEWKTDESNPRTPLSSAGSCTRCQCRIGPKRKGTEASSGGRGLRLAMRAAAGLRGLPVAAQDLDWDWSLRRG